MPLLPATSGALLTWSVSSSYISYISVILIELMLFYHSDVPVKQLILVLNETHNFVIKDLDETHVLVDPEYIELIKKEVSNSLEKNVYVEKSQK